MAFQHGLTGSASDIYRANIAKSTLEVYDELKCATWKDLFWADVTAVLAENTDEGVQQRLFDLSETIRAWDKALEQRQTRGNEEGT